MGLPDAENAACDRAPSSSIAARSCCAASTAAPPIMYVTRLPDAGPDAVVSAVLRVRSRTFASGSPRTAATSWLSIESVPSPGSAAAT